MPNENYLCGIPSGIYKCGGIAPVPATDDMTQPVGQKNGLLFTAPVVVIPDPSEGSDGDIITISDGAYVITTPVDIPDPSDANDGLILETSSGAYVLTEPEQELPTVTADDNGKFLRVVSGAWAAVTVPDAEGEDF